MSTLTAPERAHTTEPRNPYEPTPAEVEAVDNGANIGLADLEAEERDRHPIVAEMQNDRDRAAALGDVERAWDLQCGIEDMRQVQARADEIDLDECEVDL